jgi:deazaflavin-dependent oxidoreductase (nitroreductase family)
MTAPSSTRRRPLLGLRRQPGRLALVCMRLPLNAYAHGQGHLLGRTFLQFEHVGRRTGRTHQAVAMVLRDDPATRELVICSAWDGDWYRNLRARPAPHVTVGRQSFVPVQRVLDEQEAYEVGLDFRHRHPHRLRLMSRILGWGDLRDDARLRQFVREHPFVAFRPSGP